jgi:uncharacterized damage-inducible protein DinB
MIGRPEASECAEYYWRYIDRVPDGDIIDILAGQCKETIELLSGLTDEQADLSYAPGKWSIKEVIGHVIDAERVFAYRALSFARRDPAQLPSMEENDWAEASNAARRPLAQLLEDLEATRRSTITLLESLDEGMSASRGVASGYEFSVRAIAYITAGHEMHHRGVLHERYLSILPR